MLRPLLIMAAAGLLLGAGRPQSVDYRLGVTSSPGAPAVAEVEVRFRGDADGETRLDLPAKDGRGREAWRYVSDLTVRGAEATAPDAAHRILRHAPGAKVTVRYRVQSAYPRDPAGEDGAPDRGPVLRPGWFALVGELTFASPQGREHEPATFRWGRLPKGWRAVSDLEHGAMGEPLTVADVAHSISVGGSAIQVAAPPGAPGLRVVRPHAAAGFPASLPDEIGRTIAAQRAFWSEPGRPYLVALVPLAARADGAAATGGAERGDGLLLYATPGHGDRLGATVAHEHVHTWIPSRVGRMPPAGREAEVLWLSEGFADILAVRTLARAGMIAPHEAVARLDAALKAHDRGPARGAGGGSEDAEAEPLSRNRGQLLALKWDEEIRRRTGGKADLDDVLLRMRDHYRQFAPGQGPDVVTSLVSAAWVVAQVDLRPDIARHVARGERIELPEQLFDGCVDARVNVTPGFDSGFDHAASAAAKVAKGVRRRGPAWTSGLRDGMRLDAMDLRPGDTNREVALTVRPANGRAKARTIRYWPYGDADVETRSLQLAFGLEGERLAACGRKIGGL